MAIKAATVYKISIFKKWFVYIVAVISFSYLVPEGIAQSADYNFKSGSRSAALSGASITLHDVWANTHNPANLTFINYPAFGFYAENRYFTQAFASGTFAASFPLQSGSFFGNFSALAWEDYSQSKVGAGYAMQLGQHFAAAVQFNYYHISLPATYGRAGAASFELSAAGYISKQVRFGVQLLNPYVIDLNKLYKIPVPTVYSLGFSYHAPGFLVAVELEKELNYKQVYTIGSEYDINKVISIRAGVSNGPSKYAFGVGFKMNRIHAGFAFSHHEILGYTPHFSLSYQIK